MHVALLVVTGDPGLGRESSSLAETDGGRRLYRDQGQPSSLTCFSSPLIATHAGVKLSARPLDPRARDAFTNSDLRGSGNQKKRCRFEKGRSVWGQGNHLVMAAFGGMPKPREPWGLVRGSDEGLAWMVTWDSE